MKVFPNPWLFIDHDGVPSCVVPKEPTGGVDERLFVGAKVDEKRTVIVSKPAKNELRDTVQVTRWLFLGLPATELTPETLVKQKPVEVPDTIYYRKCVRRGELVLANDNALKLLQAFSGTLAAPQDGSAAPNKSRRSAGPSEV